jgi:hypothetical protein
MPARGQRRERVSDNGVVQHGLGMDRRRVLNLGNTGGGRPPADVLKERDARVAADTRNDIDRWLGTPPPGRSALDARARKIERPRTISAQRLDSEQWDNVQRFG